MNLDPELSLMIAEFGGASVDLWRSPAAAGGKVGTATQVGTAIPCIIVPTSDAGNLVGAPQGLGGGRAPMTMIIQSSAPTINNGDEVRQGTVRYQVESAANWIMGRVVGLSLPK